MSASTGEPAPIPPGAQRWLAQATVKARFDPSTGFLVAEEVVPLPAILRNAPALEQAASRARGAGVPLLAFATADRCGPCQQFKKDALNDPAVIAELERGVQAGRLVVAHVEVDREADAAQRVLGSRRLPMTYWIAANGDRQELAGQRTAADLLGWLRSRGG